MNSENQHNDNLEQFFKQHLEDYSPEPSLDFWERMEGTIPEKPSFWVYWMTFTRKYSFPILLLFGVIIISLLYWKTAEEKASLFTLTTDQQTKIEQVEQQNKVLRNKLETNILEVNESLNNETIEASSFGIRDYRGNVFDEEQKANLYKTSSIIPSSNVPPQANMNGDTRREIKENGLNIATVIPRNNQNELVVSNEMEQTTIVEIQENEALSILGKEELLANENTSSKAVDLLPLLDVAAVSLGDFKNSLSDLTKIEGSFRPSSRFSFEAGATVLMQPFKPSHLNSIAGPGAHKNIPSLGGNLLLNFELSKNWLLQSGFQVKNMKSDVLTRNYNSFPLNVKRKFARKNGLSFEFLLGFDVNLLVNARTDEGSSVQSLETSYFGWTTGLALVLPLSKKVHLILEPQINSPLTHVFGGDRITSYGLYVGVRYEN